MDLVHLVHTGIPEGWDLDAVRDWFREASEQLVRPRTGEVLPPSPVPIEVEGWLETLRFVHRELWVGVGGLGTTVVLEAAGSLWVLTRGTHRVSIVCEAGDAEPEPLETQGHYKIWHLSTGARWRVDVALEDGPGPLWSARWRSALFAVPASAAGARPVASDAVAPGEVAASVEPVRSAPPLPAPLRALVDSALGMVKHPALAPVVRYRVPLTVAAGALLVAILAWIWIPKPALTSALSRAGDFVLGRYRVHVTSVPAGAAITLDGKSTGRRTPAWLLVPEGNHRLETSLGEFGAASLDVRGSRGSRHERQAALLGRLALGCSDSEVVLYARVDGRPIGRVPVVLDSVPAGWRQVSFQGRDVRPWTEEVGLVAGTTTQVLARPERVPEMGVILARAYRVGPQGLTDQPGAAVSLDGLRKGVTPLKLEVPRGLHTVRISTTGERSPVQLLRVDGGGQLYATAEFGRSPEPEVVEEMLGSPSIAKPPVVRAFLDSQLPIRVSEMRLKVRRWGRDFGRTPMKLRAGSRGLSGDVVLDLAGAKAGMEVTYFVSILSDQGEEFVSEMHKVRVIP